MSSKTAPSFVFFAFLFLIAGIACMPSNGLSGMFAAAVGIYFMLVSANAIDRGEKRAKRKHKN